MYLYDKECTRLYDFECAAEVFGCPVFPGYHDFSGFESTPDFFGCPVFSGYHDSKMLNDMTPDVRIYINTNVRPMTANVRMYMTTKVLFTVCYLLFAACFLLLAVCFLLYATCYFFFSFCMNIMSIGLPRYPRVFRMSFLEYYVFL